MKLLGKLPIDEIVSCIDSCLSNLFYPVSRILIVEIEKGTLYTST